jgi:hypothetical protein
MKHLPIVLLLVAGCAGGPVPSELHTADGARAAYLEAPVATEGFRREWTEKDSPGVEDLLREYARVTGQTLMMTEEARHQVNRKDLVKAGGADVLEVAPEDVQAVTESLLILHQIVLIPMRAGNARIVSVISLETQERNFVRRSAIYVPEEQLDAWSDRPATLITTLLALPKTDVRTLSNSMRTMLTDANTQQIIPVGNTNSLLLTGFASDIHALAGLLRTIDDATPAPVQLVPVEPR